MKNVANNIFANWKTTLLGVAILALTIYLVERSVFDGTVFGHAIDAAAVLLGAWLAAGAKDKLPSLKKKSENKCKEEKKTDVHR